jgi:DNA-directed RNA polymerase specialized sigma24 family protein
VASISAIEEVYRRRYRRFVRVALALTGDAERAHDAVQEAFARAIRGRFGLRDERSLEAWLWRTLANACADERPRLARPARRPQRGRGAAHGQWRALLRRPRDGP